MSVKFNNYSVEVKNAMAKLAYQAVEESVGEVESQVKRNTAVATGQLKNSWTHNVKTAGVETTGTVGSPLENAIWEELGTGQYALNGNGRKGGWFYVDAEGHGHFTHGKKPRRALHKAYSSLKNKLIRHMQDIFKEGLS
jgi:hypothetical protein